MALCDPVIVIPGITATYLRDDYRLPPEMIWTVMTNDFPRATLHPDDPRYEAIEPARIMPDQIFEVAYKELIGELRYNLSPTEDSPVPVYPFSYDWRMPLVKIEERLAAFIEEVIDRTKLMRHYNQAGYGKGVNPAKVNLIGHSMGGLIIAGYLQRFGNQNRVKKVATLASPFRGSHEAALKIAVGTANMGGGNSNSSERDAARMTLALYHLLPSYAEAFKFKTPPTAPQNLFNSELWQPGVLSALSNFIRIKGLNPGNADGQAEVLFKAFLKEAEKHRQRIESLQLDSAGLNRDDWLCVVGVNCETRVEMGIDIDPATRNVQFDLSSNGRANCWKKSNPADWVKTGDGTVPYLGAVPAFLPLEKLVCVTPDDFSYWEVADISLSTIAGFHGILPNMDMLHRLIIAHLTGKSYPKDAIWGRAAPNLPAGVAWNPPIPGLKQKQP